MSKNQTLSQSQHAALDDELAAAKLSISMPKDAEYPTAWVSVMRCMPTVQMKRLAGAMANPDDVVEFHDAGLMFVDFVLRQNKKKVTEQRNKGRAAGCVEGEQDEESAANEAAVKARRAYWRDALVAMAVAQKWA